MLVVSLLGIFFNWLINRFQFFVLLLFSCACLLAAAILAWMFQYDVSDEMGVFVAVLSGFFFGNHLIYYFMNTYGRSRFVLSIRGVTVLPFRYRFSQII